MRRLAVNGAQSGLCLSTERRAAAAVSRPWPNRDVDGEEDEQGSLIGG